MQNILWACIYYASQNHPQGIMLKVNQRLKTGAVESNVLLQLLLARRRTAPRRECDDAVVRKPDRFQILNNGTQAKSKKIAPLFFCIVK